MHIWTAEPTQATWRQLRYLKSAHNVQNLLELKSSSGREAAWEPDRAKFAAREIAACIRQADEYFHASKRVGLATRPLQLFYCAQTLAKAAILASDKGSSLASLKYHGLNTRPKTANGQESLLLQQYSENSTNWEIEKEFAISHDGVFRQLCRVCDDVDAGQGTIIRFQDVIRVIPDMSEIYFRHYLEPSHCLYLYKGPSTGEQDECLFPPQENLTENDRFSVIFNGMSHGEITAVFPEFKSSVFIADSLHDDYFGFASDTISELSFAKVVSGTVAGRYLVRPHESGLHKSMPILFAGMFILSNVVRYKPAFWSDVIEGRSTGGVSIVESFCDMFEQRFANDTVELIWNEQFSYGTPAILG